MTRRTSTGRKNRSKSGCRRWRALKRSAVLGSPNRSSVPAHRVGCSRRPSARATPGQLTAILDEIFSSQPMAHWYEVFNGVHVTFGAVRGPEEVIDDPQLRANDIVVPLEGAGGKLTSTISSPIQVHGVAKVPAKCAPALGEHNEEILEQFGFSASEIEATWPARSIRPGLMARRNGQHHRVRVSGGRRPCLPKTTGTPPRRLLYSKIIRPPPADPSHPRSFAHS